MLPRLLAVGMPGFVAVQRASPSSLAPFLTGAIPCALLAVLVLALMTASLQSGAGHHRLDRVLSAAELQLLQSSRHEPVRQRLQVVRPRHHGHLHHPQEFTSGSANNPIRVHPSASPSAGPLLLHFTGTSCWWEHCCHAVVYCLRPRDLRVFCQGHRPASKCGTSSSATHGPERYRNDYVSHEQNRDVAIPTRDGSTIPW